MDCESNFSLGTRGFRYFWADVVDVLFHGSHQKVYFCPSGEWENIMKWSSKEITKRLIEMNAN